MGLGRSRVLAFRLWRGDLCHSPMQLVLLFAFILGLTLYGRSRYRGVYEEESGNTIASGMTGEAFARRILREAGIDDVELAIGKGLMPDFYDPDRRRLTLAREHFHGTSFSALGVAAHEAGHALQQVAGFRPLQWRVSAVRATMYLTLPLLIAGAVMTVMPGTGKTGLVLLIGGWGLLAGYNLGTMPIELDATERARKVIARFKPYRNLDERIGIERVMRVAGSVYIEGVYSVMSRLSAIVMPWFRRQM